VSYNSLLVWSPVIYQSKQNTTTVHRGEIPRTFPLIQTGLNYLLVAEVAMGTPTIFLSKMGSLHKGLFSQDLSPRVLTLGHCKSCLKETLYSVTPQCLI